MSTDTKAIADIAEYAIRHFAGDCDRPTAEKALHLWAHYEDLSYANRTAVLARFPEPAEREPVPGLDFLPAETFKQRPNNRLGHRDYVLAMWSA